MRAATIQGGYYFFGGALGVATIRGAASIRISDFMSNILPQ